MDYFLLLLLLLYSLLLLLLLLLYLLLACGDFHAIRVGLAFSGLGPGTGQNLLQEVDFELVWAQAREQAKTCPRRFILSLSITISITILSSNSNSNSKWTIYYYYYYY